MDAILNDRRHYHKNILHTSQMICLSLGRVVADKMQAKLSNLNDLELKVKGQPWLMVLNVFTLSLCDIWPK